MAVITNDVRVVVDDADTTTGWTGGSIVNLTTPRAEGTNCVADQLNIATGTVYFTPGAALDLDGDMLYVQSYTNALQNGWKEGTLGNSSHMLYMNDGTNELALCQAGDDRDVFKHAKTQVQFQCFLIDLDYLSTKNTDGEVLAISGSVASFVKTSVDDVGSRFVTLSKALGGGQNVFVDIIRVDEIDTDGNTTTSTSGVFIYGGTSGDRGTFPEIVTEDESNAADKAHGILREYTSGSYGCQGRLKYGTTNALDDAYFQDSNFTLTFESRDVNNDKFAIFVFGNSTDTNSFDISNGTIISAGPGVDIDMSSSNIDVLQINNINFIDTLNAISFPTDTVSGLQDHDVLNCTFDNTGTITPGTVPFDNNTITNSNATTNAVIIDQDISAVNMVVSGYEGTAGTAALQWDINTDPDGNLDGGDFTKGTAATHAIEFTSNAPLTMTLTNMDFDLYNASNGNNDSTFLFADRGSDVVWTLNLNNVTGNTSFRKARAGDTVNIVQTVTLQVTLSTEAGTDAANVRIRIEEADGTLVSQGTTNSSGVYTDGAYNYTGDLAITTICRLKGFEELRIPGTIESSGLTQSATIPTDINVNLP